MDDFCKDFCCDIFKKIFSLALVDKGNTPWIILYEAYVYLVRVKLSAVLWVILFIKEMYK
jgi:hypothetical protein